ARRIYRPAARVTTCDAQRCPKKFRRLDVASCCCIWYHTPYFLFCLLVCLRLFSSAELPCCSKRSTQSYALMHNKVGSIPRNILTSIRCLTSDSAPTPFPFICE
ncbi:unnamed protein product, partial [Pylaiella littoralis]